MKRLVKRAARQFGLSISKRPRDDLGLYSDYHPESLANRLFYNIGAGNFYHPYWTNVDYSSEHYSSVQNRPFINHNLMSPDPLPLPDGRAELVYSSHTIEHLTNQAVARMLAECHRILKPGGGLRLTAPNTELDYQAYMRRDLKYWYWVEAKSRPGVWERLYKMPLDQASMDQWFLHHFASQLSKIDLDDTPPKKYSDREIQEVFANMPMEQALDFFTQACAFNPDHPGSHINWFTPPKLVSLVKTAGFREVYPSAYGQSRFAPLREIKNFDNTHPKFSLYVEAIK